MWALIWRQSKIMTVDLHCHSYVSDGSLSPTEVVTRAHGNGVAMLALTDHDTLEGLPEAKATADSLGVRLIPGIEFSSRWSRLGVHREARAREIGRKLAKRGFEGCYEGAAAIAGVGQIGRPHFAKYLVEQGAVKNFQQAFKKYLGAGKAGDVKCHWPEIGNVVEWINDAGGVAVLAHPGHYKLTRTKLKRLVEDFTEVGGKAIEVVSGASQPADSQYHAQLANLFGLKASCGSDFHHPDNRWSDLGRFAPMPSGCEPVWELFG